MHIECLQEKDKRIAVVTGQKEIIVDVPSALDLMMTVQYEVDTRHIVLEKTLICEDFFQLSTGLAGEVLQKFMNYHIKVAIYGDYTKYHSKPLRDFIYESNKGKDFFFVATKEEAIEKLKETQ